MLPALHDSRELPILRELKCICARVHAIFKSSGSLFFLLTPSPTPPQECHRCTLWAKDRTCAGASFVTKFPKKSLPWLPPGLSLYSLRVFMPLPPISPNPRRDPRGAAFIYGRTLPWMLRGCLWRRKSELKAPKAGWNSSGMEAVSSHPSLDGTMGVGMAPFGWMGMRWVDSCGAEFI